MGTVRQFESNANIDHWQERVDMAASLRWTVKLNMHEAVANHFSLAVNDEGTQFLINPNKKHFSRVTASDLLLLDANDPDTLNRPDAPDPTAWGLHGAVHRLCPHHRCLMHVHSVYATVLASLADSNLPPIDQNTATFYNRTVIDDGYGGLAFEEEGERCGQMLQDPTKQVLIMGNHGVMVMGVTVAETFNRLFYFERACETYIKALQTGQKLRILLHDIAEKTAIELAEYPEQGDSFMKEMKAILDEESSNYAT